MIYCILIIVFILVLGIFPRRKKGFVLYGEVSITSNEILAAPYADYSVKVKILLKQKGAPMIGLLRDTNYIWKEEKINKNRDIKISWGKIDYLDKE